MKGGNFKRFSLKMLCCEARAFPVCTAYGYTIDKSAIFFTPRKTRMHMNLDHVASGGETFIVSSIIGHCMPAKVCPQCKSAVSTCKMEDM